MIFNVRRASFFPIVLEANEEETLYRLEEEERYTELEYYEQQLRKSDALKELKVEADKLEEVLIFLNSLGHVGPIILNFNKREIIIDDVSGFTC